jgi:hypothetical protein
MKELFILSTLFLTLQTALAFEVELKTYSIDGKLGVDDLSSILSSGARNLKDTNCIRGKLFNNYIHASAIAQGCYIESIDVRKAQSSTNKNDLDIAFAYRCERSNTISSTVYNCELK